MDRIHRLSSSRDFARVLRRGTRASRGPIACAVTPDDGSLRLGITVTRRTGKAVHRNRAKRRIREAFRASSATSLQNLDVVLIARGDVEGRPFQNLVEDVGGAVHEAASAC